MDDNTNCPGGYEYHPWPTNPRHWRLHAQHIHLFHGEEMSEIHRLKNALQAADYLNRQLHQELEQTKTNYHALYQVFGATVCGHPGAAVTLHVSGIERVFNVTREIHQDGELVTYKAEIIEYADTDSLHQEGE